MRAFKYILLLILLAMPAVIRLQAADDNASLAANRERWQSLSQEEKQAIIQAYKQWKGLPEGERQQLREKYEKFKSLKPEEKLAVAVNAKRWSELKDDDRKHIRQEFSRDGSHFRLGATFRIVGLMMEENKPATKPAVAERLRQLYEEFVLGKLTDAEREEFARLATPREKIAFMETAILKIFEDKKAEIIEAHQQEFQQLSPDSVEYKRLLLRYCFPLLSEKVTESLPPSQIEMAHFFRMNAPQPLLAEIAALQPGKLDDETVAQIAQRAEVKEMLEKMPPKMKERFESFDEKKKLQTIKMGLLPFTRLNPLQLRMNENGRHRPGGVPPRDHGDNNRRSTGRPQNPAPQNSAPR